MAERQLSPKLLSINNRQIPRGCHDDAGSTPYAEPHLSNARTIADELQKLHLDLQRAR